MSCPDYLKKNISQISTSENIAEEEIKKFIKQIKLIDKILEANSNSLYWQESLKNIKIIKDNFREYKVVSSRWVTDNNVDEKPGCYFPRLGLSYIIGNKGFEGENKQLVHERFLDYRLLKVVKDGLEYGSNKITVK